MNWEAVGALAEALGAAAVVLSLIYLSVQLRQGTHQARTNALRDLVQELGRVSQAVAADADLAQIVFQGTDSFESLTPVEQTRYRSFLNHLFSLLEQQFQLHGEGAVSEENWTPLEAMMVDFLSRTGCQHWWKQRSLYHSQSFRDYVDGKLDHLRHGEGVEESTAWSA